MKKQFKEKYGDWAVITGGTSGIGEAASHIIAKEGINIVLVARTQKVLDFKATTLSSKYGIKVKTIQADLSLIEGYKKVVSETILR